MDRLFKACNLGEKVKYKDIWITNRVTKPFKIKSLLKSEIDFIRSSCIQGDSLLENKFVEEICIRGCINPRFSKGQSPFSLLKVSEVELLYEEILKLSEYTTITNEDIEEMQKKIRGNNFELNVISLLIRDKNWKVKDVIDLINAPNDIKVLFYASILNESEDNDKAQRELKSKSKY